MLDDFSFFIKNVVRDSGSEHVPVIIREDLFDFVLRSLVKAPEHLLLTALKFKFHDAVYKLVISIFLVVVRIDRTVVLQDGDPEIVIPVQILLDCAFDLFFYDQSLQRPVLDLHAVGIVVNIVAVIHQCHVIGQRDQIIKADLTVIVRSLNFLQMIDFIEVDVVLVTVNDRFAVLIGGKDHFAHFMIVVKIQTFLRKELELHAGQFFARIITVDFDDLEARDSAFAFTRASVFFGVLNGLVLSFDADLVNDLLRSVTGDHRLIRDDHFRGIRHRICGDRAAIVGAFERIRYALPFRNRCDDNGAVINTEIRTERVSHLHGLAII